MKILFGICGSFCCHKSGLEALEHLVGSGNNVVPVLSAAASATDTRFGNSEQLCKTVEYICGTSPILTIPSAEKHVTGGGFDIMVICPCTGNTLSKLAHGITDGPVTMGAKAMCRNRKPIVIGFASNDGLSCSLKNIGLIAERKNFYFVPMRQDDFVNKPTSLVCDFSLTEQTVMSAMAGRQLQPMFRSPVIKEVK